jgi:Zn-dependent membrane protease YugP
VILLGAALLALLLLGPVLYVRAVMAAHGRERADIPGTGGELARHLLDEAGLHDVAVERTDEGDHYDPAARAVRLSPEHLGGRSVTALAVAAHEVAHAVQHRDGMALFRLRGVLAAWLVHSDRIARIVLLATPVVALALRSPGLMAGQLALGIGVMALGVVVHAVTLPVELDASFRRALPVLGRGYLAGEDLGRARRVLRAAALTYLAGALLSLVNVARWIRVFR